MFQEKPIINPESQKEIIKKYKLNNVTDNSNWDENVFIESYNELIKILEKSENPRLTLSKFYEDAFFLKKDQDYSDYEDQFSMPPIKDDYANNQLTQLNFIKINNWQNSKEIIATDIVMLFNYNTGSTLYPLRRTQYGPSRIYKLDSSCFTFIPNDFFEKNDIIGSDAFGACTALIIKMPKGIFFAHITTGALGVKELLNKLKTELEDNTEIHLIRPEWTENGKRDEIYEKQWLEIEKEFLNLKVNKYAYIADKSDRPKNINDSSILINQDKIMIIGRNRYPSNKKPTIIDEFPEDNSEFDYDTYREIDF